MSPLREALGMYGGELRICRFIFMAATCPGEVYTFGPAAATYARAIQRFARCLAEVPEGSIATIIETFDLGQVAHRDELVRVAQEVAADAPECMQ